MTSIRGYDDLSNPNINDIALMNYNKGIANRLRLQEQKMQQNLPFKEPKMLGGVRYSNTVLPGTSADGPATLAVGGRAYRVFTGKETAMQGGKFSLSQLAKDTGNISKKILKVGVPALSGAIGTIEGGPVTGLAAAKASSALTDYVLGSGRKPRGRKPKGGKVSMKDVVDWGKFGVETVGDAVGLAKKVRGGSKLEDAKKYKNMALSAANEAFGLYDKVKRATGGMVYSQELKDALGGCGDCSGGKMKPKKATGAKPARFEKGSQAARDHMAKIRAMKKK